jgi:hypothetical protein
MVDCIAELGATILPTPLNEQCDWCIEKMKTPGQIHMIYNRAGDVQLADAEFQNGHPNKNSTYVITIPKKYIFSFRKLYCSINGVEPAAPIYMKIFLYKDWQNKVNYYEDTDTTEPVGWHFHANTISH